MLVNHFHNNIPVCAQLSLYCSCCFRNLPLATSLSSPSSPFSVFTSSALSSVPALFPSCIYLSVITPFHLSSSSTFIFFSVSVSICICHLQFCHPGPVILIFILCMLSFFAIPLHYQLQAVGSSSRSSGKFFRFLRIFLFDFFFSTSSLASKINNSPTQFNRIEQCSSHCSFSSF